VIKIAIILAVLSTDGHWLSGHAGEVMFARTDQTQSIDAQVHWQLSYEQKIVDSGTLDWKGTDRHQTLRLVTPQVRTPLPMLLSWQVLNIASQERIDTGEHLLTIYPDTILKELDESQIGRLLVIGDSAHTPQCMLGDIPIIHEHYARTPRLSDPTNLPDTIIVSPYCENLDFAHQRVLKGYAQRGAHVLLLQQSNVNLKGFGVSTDPKPSSYNTLQWTINHPLIQNIDTKSLQLPATTESDRLHSLIIDPASPHEIVCSVVRRTKDVEDNPVVKPLITLAYFGQGMIVFCQYPFSKWTEDPRSQQFLVNTLSFNPLKQGATSGAPSGDPR